MSISLLMLLAGCGGEPEGESVTAPAEQVVMTFQTLDSSRLEDLERVRAAVNAITIPEIGVEVQFKLVDAVEAFSAYPLWISNGERVDLMILNYQDIIGYINRDMLYALDDLLAEYGQGILEIDANTQYHPMEGSVINGSTYGVLNIYEQGSGVGIWIEQYRLEEVGFDYQEKKVYSMEELGELWRLLKERYPESYPLGQITSGSTYSSFGYYLTAGDTLGADTVTGIVVDGTVVDFYETEEYYQFLQCMRDWYQAEYIYPDAAVTDASVYELVEAGICLGYPLTSSPGSLADSGCFSRAAVCLRTSVPGWNGHYGRAGFWVIPVASRAPEAAMKFLNLMLTDERIGNLLSYGIEEEHYRVVDEEWKVIDFPEGKDAETIGYFNPMGLYGDYTKIYSRGTVELKKAQIAYAEEAAENPFTGITNISYSTADVAVQVEALENVVAKYVPVLESGSVNLEKYYPEFIAQLKAAGLDEVIADKQRQLDEWKKNE